MEAPQTPCSLEAKAKSRDMTQCHTLAHNTFPYRAAVKLLLLLSLLGACSAEDRRLLAGECRLGVRHGFWCRFLPGHCSLSDPRTPLTGMTAFQGITVERELGKSTALVHGAVTWRSVAISTTEVASQEIQGTADSLPGQFPGCPYHRPRRQYI